jgi:hypothetical protein
MRDYVTLCGSFLKLHEEEVGLVYQSAKDYLLPKDAYQTPVLEEFCIKLDRAHLELARTCLNYIHETSCSPQSELFNYAVQYWPEHTRGYLSHGKELLDLSLPFFEKKSILRSKWSEFYFLETLEFHPSEMLHMASCFGIVAWVRILITKKTRKFTFRRPVNMKIALTAGRHFRGQHEMGMKLQ